MPDPKTTNTIITADDIESEVTIIRLETEAAPTKLKVRKAPGIDQVTAEMVLAIGEVGIDIIHRICQSILTHLSGRMTGRP